MRDSNFVKTFGKVPFILVIDFLLENYLFDYSKTEVAREVRISRITIEKIWKTLIEKKLIIKTKKIGNATLYRLNLKAPVIKKLREIDFILSSKPKKQANQTTEQAKQTTEQAIDTRQKVKAIA